MKKTLQIESDYLVAIKDALKFYQDHYVVDGFVIDEEYKLDVACAVETVNKALGEE